MAVTAELNPPTANGPKINGTTTAASATNGANGTNGETPAANDTNPIPAWAGPDLSRLLRVEHGPNYTTKSISLVSLPPGALFARITSASVAPSAVYTTVQCGPDAHIELNSDLRYINHSCAPTLVFDMEAWEVRVAPADPNVPGSDKGLRAGDELTFFYPSTEWVMDRAFECLCGEQACLGYVGGARDLPDKVLGRYWVSRHVREMKERQREEKAAKRVSAGGAGALGLGEARALGFRSVAGGGVA